MRLKTPLIPEVCRPRDLDNLAAQLAAEATAMCKLKGENDHDFIERIVCAYMNAVTAIYANTVEAPNGLQ